MDIDSGTGLPCPSLSNFAVAGAEASGATQGMPEDVLVKM